MLFRSSLRKLASALGTENERITGLFNTLSDDESAQALLELYQEMVGAGQLSDALLKAAELSMQHGDFTPLFFPEGMLDAVTLEQSPGVPDIEMHESELEATYSGVPYPLP